jgi:hypothetical protein
LYTKILNFIIKLITSENALEIVTLCVKYRIEGTLKQICWQNIKNSGGKDELIECLFEMHLASIENSTKEKEEFKNLQKEFQNLKFNYFNDIKNLQKEIQNLKNQNLNFSDILNKD